MDVIQCSAAAPRGVFQFVDNNGALDAHAGLVSRIR